MKTLKTKTELYEFIQGIITNDVKDTLAELYRDSLKDNHQQEPNFNYEKYLYAYIEEILEAINYNPSDNSFNDDDCLHEWIDRQVDIYYHDIYRTCPIFADYTNEALEEYGTIEQLDLSKILQSGQYFFYDTLARQVVEALEELN